MNAEPSASARTTASRRRQGKPEQLTLSYRTWGGSRKGAGRKAGPKPPIPHRPRKPLNPRHPVHVTLRVRRDVPNLRSQVMLAALGRAFAGARGRFGMRLVHFSVQGNHLHLLVEADSAQALSRGMAGLGIRMARRLNGAIGRRGAAFAERYHAQVIENPRQARHALRYVLLNARLHALREDPVGARRGPVLFDPCSSARCFDGWQDGARDAGHAPCGEPSTLVMPAQTWLLRVGWRLWGSIDPSGLRA